MGRGAGHLGRDDKFAGQLRLAGLGKREGDHIGRPVVSKVVAVDPVNGLVVDKGNRDGCSGHSLAGQDAAGQPGQATDVDLEKTLRGADLDDEGVCAVRRPGGRAGSRVASP